LTLSARHIIVLLACLLSYTAQAQILDRLDSVKLEQVKIGHNKFVNNIFQQAMNSIRHSPEAGPSESVLNGKSEDPYKQYQGKIIRHIIVNTLNFDRNFDDTTQTDNSFATRVGKRFHKTTRPWVIKDNMFIKEGTPLNAFKVADNERYLRTLDYIRDARIIVVPVKHHKDSVDVVVYTKDFFSIAGGAAAQDINHINANLYETNLAGMAQRLEISGLYNSGRSPNWGYGALYRKNNLFHTFTDGTVGISTMNQNPVTREEEKQAIVALSKQVISPYTRTAGAISFSHNEADNRYLMNDTQFFKYSYNQFDMWAGYNIGIRQLTATNNTIRDRRFLALRYTNRRYTDVPWQVGERFDPIYNNTQSLLAQMTFFRQDYYKTQYIYGFGTTEDFPYGYNISVVAGWQKQRDLERPYAGLKVLEYIATNTGDFIQLSLKSGGYLNNGKIQDGSLLLGATLFSRIIFWNTTKIRQYANLSYSQVYDRLTTPQLRIDNGYGLRGFLSDSVYGTKRLSLQLETEFYLKRKILGFKFAPFPYGDLTVITPENKPYSSSSLYASIGGGIRARNENLVFQTIEARAYYFPIAPTNMKGFKVIVTSNIRFRYNSTYVTAPDVVQLNGD
jgi:hypothetical protein